MCFGDLAKSQTVLQIKIRIYVQNRPGTRAIMFSRTVQTTAYNRPYPGQARGRGGSGSTQIPRWAGHRSSRSAAPCRSSCQGPTLQAPRLFAHGVPVYPYTPQAPRLFAHGVPVYPYTLAACSQTVCSRCTGVPVHTPQAPRPFAHGVPLNPYTLAARHRLQDCLLTVYRCGLTHSPHDTGSQTVCSRCTGVPVHTRRMLLLGSIPEAPVVAQLWHRRRIRRRWLGWLQRQNHG
jgi:hypothetical protein